MSVMKVGRWVLRKTKLPSTPHPPHNSAFRRPQKCRWAVEWVLGRALDPSACCLVWAFGKRLALGQDF